MPIWDTAYPPRLSDCQFYTKLYRSQYLRTINLINLQGITFFYSVGRLYGIFPYLSSKSSALLKLQRLGERRGGR